MAPHPTDPAVVFAELGRTKLSEISLDGLLGRVATLARQTLPGADEVSITMMGEQGPYTAAYTGELALRLDERQYEHLLGPCLQAAAEKTTVSVPQTAADTRWSGWALRAASAGVGSVLAVGLPIVDDLGGALNIYGRRPGAFGDDVVTLAQTFAGYAAVALGNAFLYHRTAELARHLKAAMESRAVIEQAKGVIMAERRCTAEEAFAFLTAISQDTNRKLRDVAAALIAGIARTSAQ
jgi:GAF domain-containing protein